MPHHQACLCIVSVSFWTGSDRSDPDLTLMCPHPLGTRFAPRNVAWPPKGTVLNLHFEAPVSLTLTLTRYPICYPIRICLRLLSVFLPLSLPLSVPVSLSLSLSLSISLLSLPPSLPLSPSLSLRCEAPVSAPDAHRALQVTIKYELYQALPQQLGFGFGLGSYSWHGGMGMYMLVR